MLEQRGITPWMPVFGQYKATIEGFTYNSVTDSYTCLADKPLPFRKYDTSADGNWLKIYWAAYQDCQRCPLKPTCVPTAKRKQLTRTAYDPAYRRARQQSPKGQAMRRKRQSTVEPVFGNLIHHYGLRRVGTRGKAGAQKTMLLAAIAYNLKKPLKYPPRKGKAIALALPPPPPAWPPFRMRTRQTVFRRNHRSNSLPNRASSATAMTVYIRIKQGCLLGFTIIWKSHS